MPVARTAVVADPPSAESPRRLAAETAAEPPASCSPPSPLTDDRNGLTPGSGPAGTVSTAGR
jgi:hypothetical protein